MTIPLDLELSTTGSESDGGLWLRRVPSREANDLVIQHHYLHRKAPISYAYGLFLGADLLGVVTFGTPPSRHLQISACPSDPAMVLELNRLWVDDVLPPNTESWFVSRALKLLPARIVVSYADPAHGHYGYIYRALNFNYSGWTDMERRTPRYDYIPMDATKHSREASRSRTVVFTKVTSPTRPMAVGRIVSMEMSIGPRCLCGPGVVLRCLASAYTGGGGGSSSIPVSHTMSGGELGVGRERPKGMPSAER